MLLSVASLILVAIAVPAVKGWSSIALREIPLRTMELKGMDKHELKETIQTRL